MLVRPTTITKILAKRFLLIGIVHPRRKLDSHEANACNPATGDFINGDKCESVPLRTLSFRTMFQIRERGTILLDKNRSTVRVAIHRVSQSVSNILVRGALSRSETIYRRSRTSVITKPTVVKTCSVISFVSPTVCDWENMEQFYVPQQQHMTMEVLVTKKWCGDPCQDIYPQTPLYRGR